MPIQINQKFPRCQLCGKLIPLRAEPQTVILPDGKSLSFCSQVCRQEYEQRLESRETARV